MGTAASLSCDAQAAKQQQPGGHALRWRVCPWFRQTTVCLKAILPLPGREFNLTDKQKRLSTLTRGSPQLDGDSGTSPQCHHDRGRFLGTQDDCCWLPRRAKVKWLNPLDQKSRAINSLEKHVDRVRLQPSPPLSSPVTSTNIRRLQSNGAFCCIYSIYASCAVQARPLTSHGYRG